MGPSGILTPLDRLPLVVMDHSSFSSRRSAGCMRQRKNRRPSQRAPNFAYQLREGPRRTATSTASTFRRSRRRSAAAARVARAVRAFADAFAPFGFDSAFAPSYGLAEATLLVSSGRRRGGPRIFSGPVRDEEAATGSTDVRAVLLGPPVGSVAVRILDAAGNALPEDAIGEIEISGPSVGRAAGSGDPDAAGPRALTGDLGFLHGGEVVVTGRRKELMILRGANVYPADAEAAASAADPAVGPAGVAAFGIVTDGTEEMVVAFEVTAARSTRPRSRRSRAG
jgi:acyl-CoA synthetase (AMP-forming)/AMP-acid ligase II